MDLYRKIANSGFDELPRSTHRDRHGHARRATSKLKRGCNRIAKRIEAKAAMDEASADS